MSDDAEFVRMAALKSFNNSVHMEMAASALANSIMIQALLHVLERRMGSDIRSDYTAELKNGWEVIARAMGDNHPMASSTSELLQNFINSIEGK